MTEQGNINHPEFLTHEQLQSLSGYRRTAEICKWLESYGILYTEGKGGRVCTSVMAFNQALGVNHNLIFSSVSSHDDTKVEVEAI